jgi:hypothetical protein
MGSPNSDEGHAIAVDGSGNVYVAGESNATWGATPVNVHAGDYDAFAAKLNSIGVRQWNTFMGSGSEDYSSAIAVDGIGNVYVAGYSNATWGSPENPHAGGGNAFAAMLVSDSGCRRRMLYSHCGSLMEPHVKVLQEIQDRFLHKKQNCRITTTAKAGPNCPCLFIDFPYILNVCTND